MANSILRLARLPRGQTPPPMGSSREGGHEMHSVRTVMRERGRDGERWGVLC